MRGSIWRPSKLQLTNIKFCCGDQAVVNEFIEREGLKAKLR